jgi:hypothetical protein
VRYLKPDGSSGVYDHLPDGGSGFRFNGNVLTMELAPQLLTCAGAVQVQVELSYQEQRIATFAFLIVVEQAVAMDGETGDYVNWTKAYLPQTSDAEQGQYLQIAQVDEDGRVVELAPVDDPAAEVKVQIPVLENHILAVGQRVEDAAVDARDALLLATKAVTGPDTAKIGQIMAVKSVDQNGKPTMWEAVDLPVAADSSQGWKLLNEITLEESEGTEVSFTVAYVGNPFSCDEIYLMVFGVASQASGWALELGCTTNPEYPNVSQGFGLAGNCLNTDGFWSFASVEHISEVDWRVSLGKCAASGASEGNVSHYDGIGRYYEGWQAKPDGPVRMVKILPFSGTFSAGFKAVLYGR